MADEAAVSPAFQPQRGNPRFPLFESLRGIAILAIVMLHTLQWGNPRSSWIGLLLVQMNSGVAYDAGVTTALSVNGRGSFGLIGGGAIPLTIGVSYGAANRYLTVSATGQITFSDAHP